MTTTPLGDLARCLVTSGVAPDVSVAAGARAPPDGGRSRWRSEVDGSTALFFDLASLTKPMTAVAFVRSGIDRRTLLGELLPETRETPSARVPLELFLSHRAGLEANALLVGARAAGGPLREAAAARRLEAIGDPPSEGFEPLYSDLGYILAGEALARATGARDAGEAIARWVLEPLGIAEQCGTKRELTARGVRGPFAPTETVASRGGAIIGAVHDENAWALTGEGGSGHAGIFGTAGAVLAFGEAVLDGLDGLDHTLLDPLSWLIRERPGGSLRAGFDGKSASASSAGDRFGPKSFGHLGFTGTSLWIDPDAKVVGVLLTNRVCPSRTNLAIRAARPWAHGALYDRALALRSP